MTYFYARIIVGYDTSAQSDSRNMTFLCAHCCGLPHVRTSAQSDLCIGMCDMTYFYARIVVGYDTCAQSDLHDTTYFYARIVVGYRKSAQSDSCADVCDLLQCCSVAVCCSVLHCCRDMTNSHV